MSYQDDYQRREDLNREYIRQSQKIFDSRTEDVHRNYIRQDQRREDLERDYIREEQQREDRKRAEQDKLKQTLGQQQLSSNPYANNINPVLKPLSKNRVQQPKAKDSGSFISKIAKAGLITGGLYLLAKGIEHLAQQPDEKKDSEPSQQGGAI